MVVSVIQGFVCTTIAKLKKPWVTTLPWNIYIYIYIEREREREREENSVVDL